MHIAIVGAGALGTVYGARLALHGQLVSFVVRPSQLPDDRDMTVQRVGHEPQTLARPQRVESIPASAQVVLLCVRADNLDDHLREMLLSVDVPVVVLTPLFPQDLARMREWLGPRLVEAMPSVAAYANDQGVVRYWVSRFPGTLLDRDHATAPVLQLAGALSAAGIRTNLQADVAATNLATTIVFLPLVIALDGHGTIAKAMTDDQGLELAVAAMGECRRVARQVGKLPMSFVWLERLASVQRLRWTVRMMQRFQPEPLHFFDVHFGSKTRRQNAQLAGQVLRLGQDKGVTLDAFRALVARGSGPD